MRNKQKPIKYIVDEINRKRFPAPLFTTIVTHIVNQAAVDEFRRKNGRLPRHVAEEKQ